MTTKQEVSREVAVLIGAKDLLEKMGWGQHRGVGYNGQLCLAAAIQYSAHIILRGVIKGETEKYVDIWLAADGWFARQQEIEKVVRACMDLLPDPVKESVPHWNDRAGRTKADVMEALDAAIAKGMGATVLQEACAG